MAVSIYSPKISTTNFHFLNPHFPCFAATPISLPFHSTLQKQGTRSVSKVVVQSTSTTGGIEGSGASTLKKTANRKKISSVEYNEVQQYDTLMYPLLTESVIKKLANENTLVFRVDKRATKKTIRDAFEKMFNVKIKKVNTLINYDDTKKAFIMLPADVDAGALAKKFNIM